MGATYHYTNLTKREWFAADVLGGNSKRSGVGLALTARAFDLLLLGSEPPTTSSTVAAGRWSTDRVSLIGDSDENWLLYLEEFVDIEADVILMLYANDGFDQIGSAAQKDNRLFMELCHLIVTRQAPELDSDMKQQFGADYRQRYKQLCSKHTWFNPKDVAFGTKCN